MKKHFWILAIVLLLMTGCQTEGQVDIAPDSTVMETDETASSNEQADAANSPYDNLDVPKSYSISDIVCPSGKLTIHIDAAIEVPVIPLPIARVRKTMFTSSSVKRYADILFANATPVASDSVYRTPTKGYLQREINSLQADIASWDASIQAKYELYNGKEDAREALLKLKEQLASAPDMLPGITPDYSVMGTLASYLAMPDDQTVSRIDVLQTNNQSVELTYIRDSFLNVDDVTGQKEDISDLVTISEEDALALAEKTLTDLELSDFSCTASSTVNYEYGTKGAYVFYFSRQVNGATETYTNETAYVFASTEKTNTQEDSQTWKYEKIHILVDDEGLLLFNYTSPSEITDIIADQTTKLLTFSEIANVFEQNIHRIDQPNAVISYTKDYYITDIELGLMSIPEDDYETALLTPVWDFMGYTNINNIEGASNRRESFMTINAADGSIINRSNKYKAYE